MSQTFHGERLWEEIVTRTHGLRKAVARILEDRAWLTDLPDEFVEYICKVEGNIEKALNDYERILRESQVWTFSDLTIRSTLELPMGITMSKSTVGVCNQSIVRALVCILWYVSMFIKA